MAAGTTPIEIVRSARRRKTVQAVLQDGVIRVLVPASMSTADVDRYVADLVPRLERRYRSDHIDLDRRVAELARRFELPRPRSVAWADNQLRRWGSCTVATGEIRVSRRLAEYPPWVLDYVLVHELAHLVVADHSPAFQSLVDRYRLAERARGYLMAKAGDSGEGDGDGGDGLDDDFDDADLDEDDGRGADVDLTDPIIDLPADLAADPPADLQPTLFPADRGR